MKMKSSQDPLVAIIFSFLFPGLGQVYAGRVHRGVLFAAGHVLSLWGFLIYLLHPQTRLNVMLGLLIIIVLTFEIFVLVDAYILALRKRGQESGPKSRQLKKGLLLIPILLLIMFCLNGNILVLDLIKRHVVVMTPPEPTRSMEPTIQRGDMFLINKFLYKYTDPQAGDVIVFNYPHDERRAFVKRIVAVGGEVVETQGSPAQILVPADHYYVLGDNRPFSKDSRHWGFVPRKNIIGRATKILYPLERCGRLID